MHLLTSLGVFAGLLQQVYGSGPRQQAHFEPKSNSQLLARQSRDDTAGVKDGMFHQPTDHNNSSLRTFEQRYWYSLNYANGSNPPIVLIAPLDTEAEQVQFWLHDDYVIGGMIAKRIGAIMLMFENRYFGKSSPFQKLTTENMELYTEDQIISDKIHLANSQSCRSRKGIVPVQIKCLGFTLDTFWASWASSAPPQAIPAFWRYFDAAKAYMPKNCTTDVGKVIDYLDDIMPYGSADKIQKIKEMFGASELEHNDDFMNLLSYGPQTFQGSSLRIHDTWQFCGYVENTVDTTDKSKLPGAQGVRVQKALAGYARWTKEIWMPGKCEQQGPWKEENNTGCFNFGDADSLVYANRKLDAPSIVDTLQVQWLFCNEPEEYWQTGSPKGTPTLVSRLVNKEFFRKTCARYFRERYDLGKGKTAASWNARYGGWSNLTYLNRTILVNGMFDPWRAASFASPQRPGGILGNNTYVKHFLNPAGNHCTDTYCNAGDMWPEVRAIQEAGIAQIAEWVSTFPKPRENKLLR